MVCNLAGQASSRASQQATRVALCFFVERRAGLTSLLKVVNKSFLFQVLYINSPIVKEDN